MSIQLRKPYKIMRHKIKRYTLHYNIPAEQCVVVPLSSYGDDVACEVRWEDENGVLQLKERLLFNADNIEPLNEFQHFQLYELWKHYYNSN